MIKQRSLEEFELEPGDTADIRVPINGKVLRVAFYNVDGKLELVCLDEEGRCYSCHESMELEPLRRPCGCMERHGPCDCDGSASAFYQNVEARGPLAFTAKGCYCSSLPDSTCDFCSGLRAYEG